jgi:methyl-accepting chemotaxis protein
VTNIRIGIQAKLTIAISVLALGFAAFFSIYFPIQQTEVADDLLQSRSESLTRVLGTLGEASLVALDLGGAETLSSDLGRAGAADLTIGYLAVLKPDGSVVARYRKTGLPESIERHQRATELTVERDDYLHIALPLRHEGNQLGTLIAGFSRQAVFQARSDSQTIALVVSAIMFLVGLGFAWVIGRTVALPVRAVALDLDRVAIELVATARQQEASSAEEAAAVTETRRSMELLFESAQQIATQSSEVLGNAERTVHGSQQISARIEQLNVHAEKVGEVLATIMSIADRADLLALNASLEGTKAGEVGKGFILVAAEMRRLAENVMASATEIRALMKEMRQASQSAVDASQSGVQSSDATTGSARDLARLTQQQRQSTEQVIASMTEMQEVLRVNIESVQRSTQSAHSLVALSQNLLATVDPRHPKARAQLGTVKRSE